jgi:Nif-specific regulatory protein
MLTICQQMNAERDLTALLELIAREAARLTGADRASIFLLDRDKHELWSHVALGSDPIRFDASLGIAGAAIRSGHTINVADTHHDPRFYPGIDALAGYHTQNLLAVPLLGHAEEVIGAFEVLNKHSGVFTQDDEELLKALAAQAAVAIETAQMLQALHQHRDQLLTENSQLWKEVSGQFSSRSILGTSENIRQIVKLVEQLSDSAVDVLLTGESGTGKGLLARALHYSSPRARRALVTLNCAALPESLVESELFGIEKGVATGVKQRIGKFEAAHGGTLFLDEIGDLSLTAQAKILYSLQERVIERIGSRTAIPLNVRIIAATNKDLSAEVKRGTFREDLYYRLNVVHIHMPPLRDLPEDIPLLAYHFLTTYCQQLHKEPKQLTPGALKALQNYLWPGNVRELENEMKRAVALTRGIGITEEDLSDNLRASLHNEPAGRSSRHPLKTMVEDLEKRLIRETLHTCQSNQQRTAERLGLSRQGLIKKMKRYGITTP